MTRSQAKDKAIELSIKHWNTYFQVLKVAGGYDVSRYYGDNAIAFALKGKYTNHV